MFYEYFKGAPGYSGATQAHRDCQYRLGAGFASCKSQAQTSLRNISKPTLSGVGQKGISEVCAQDARMGKPKADTNGIRNWCRSLNLFEAHPQVSVRRMFAPCSPRCIQCETQVIYTIQKPRALALGVLILCLAIVRVLLEWSSFQAATATLTASMPLNLLDWAPSWSGTLIFQRG